jgi:predicted nucleic acid-binding protein
MLLLDTSVWIDLLANRQTEAVRFALSRRESEDLALTEMIYLEVLQGISDARVFETVQHVLSQQQVLQPSHGLESYEAAARLYALGRKRGITVRTAVDCLVAQIALESDALLVHNDRDYLALARIEPRLQVFPSAAAHQ